MVSYMNFKPDSTRDKLRHQTNLCPSRNWNGRGAFKMRAVAVRIAFNVDAIASCRVEHVSKRDQACLHSTRMR